MIDLYCFGESGNSYKAALPLELSGLSWRPVFVDFFNGETRTPAFRALNVMGECPVMVDGDEVISQSGAIQEHVSARSGLHAGATDQERRDVRRWVLWDNHKLSGLAGVARFLIHFAPPERRPEQVVAWLQGRLAASYSVLDQHLSTRSWIVGGGPTNADFSCCGYLYYPEPYGFVRSEWPHIDAWLSRISGLPGWTPPYDLMPGSPADRGVAGLAKGPE